MNFTARLRQHSAIWQMWRQHNRTGGAVDGILFRWTQGNVYVSGPLNATQVAAAAAHTDIEVVGFEVAPSEMQAIEGLVLAQSGFAPKAEVEAAAAELPLLVAPVVAAAAVSTKQALSGGTAGGKPPYALGGQQQRGGRPGGR